MNLRLRKATLDDMDILYKWANDKEVRKNAFHSEPIPYEKHVEWFNRIMNDDSVLQFILCNDNELIGQIRLNIEKDKAYIDYSVSPDKRGQGIGSALIKLLIKEASIKTLSIKTLVGQVKYENKASAKVFENCNFTRTDKPDYIEYLMTMEKHSEDNNSNHQILERRASL
jgi:RimJ/RimL family protein N-acetyltransferase